MSVCRVMEVSAHSLFLLQQLNIQREFGFLCDCTVAIGNVFFKAHRAVLAAFSNYFKMIFIHQSRSGRLYCYITVFMWPAVHGTQLTCVCACVKLCVRV